MPSEDGKTSRPRGKYAKGKHRTLTGEANHERTATGKADQRAKNSTKLRQAQFRVAVMKALTRDLDGQNGH